jgi:steroid 5-alpha reductase family enzyme
VSALALLATTLGCALGAMLLLWALSLALRDASIVDIWWGPGIALVVGVAFALAGGGHPRRVLLLALVVLWALRLGGYLLWRNAGRGEDPRYQAMRRHHGARFAWLSLVTVFGLQGVLQWLVALPLQLAQLAPGPERLGALDAAGVALYALGLGFEAVGDWQLARFRDDPTSRGRVLDSGLWRYTRHPNYFGDCTAHWGMFVVALATPWGWLGVLGPLAMTVLLLRVSGVTLLERSIGKRRPEYADYQRRTSAFIPWPPRAAAPRSD